MTYDHVVAGRFIARPNRFIAFVELEGRTETVHVKNTGRCRELLAPGAAVYLVQNASPARKTRYDLVAVEKGDRLINMDSQAPNAAALEWLRAGNVFGAGALIKPEFTYGDSRFDVAAFTPELALLEVKGVTLERDGMVLFPDAPTARGTKHLRELACFAASGGQAYILFVIQMENVLYFTPNEATDPAFAAALRAARDAGVHILAYDCHVAPDSMVIRRPVEIRM